MTAEFDKLDVEVDFCLLRILTCPKARHQSTNGDNIVQHVGGTAVPVLVNISNPAFVFFPPHIFFHQASYEVHVCFYMITVNCII